MHREGAQSRRCCNWFYNVQIGFVLSVLMVACSSAEKRSPISLPEAKRRIVAVIPPGWSVAAPTDMQEGFRRKYFIHPETESFVLVGPRTNYMDWTDRSGTVHREDVANECIFIWLVPGDFKPNFPRFPAEP